LRRARVVLVTPLALALGLVYVTALSVVYVWDGELGAETDSPGKVWLDRAYSRTRGALARAVRVSAAW